MTLLYLTRRALPWSLFLLAQLPAQSQVSHWPGNGDANDASGTNHGSLVGGMAYGPGLFGQAFHGSTAGDYVSIPDAPSLNFGLGDFSVSAWVRTSFLGGTASDFIAAKTSVGFDQQFVLAYLASTTGAPRFSMASSGNLATAQAQCSIADGNWHHLVGTRKGTALRLYVDGSLAASAYAAGPISATSSNPVTIGGRMNQASDPTFLGDIDEVKLWGAALTAGQVSGEYSAGEPGVLPLQCPVAPAAYCNAKVSSAGCVTAISTSNALSGPVSGAGDYFVTATAVQELKNGLLFVGISGAASLPFGGGTLCVQPPTKRGPIMNSGGDSGLQCEGSFATLVNNGVVVPAGLDAGSGNSAWYQYWYRDPANGAGLLGTALSNGIELHFQ